MLLCHATIRMGNGSFGIMTVKYRPLVLCPAADLTRLYSSITDDPSLISLIQIQHWNAPYELVIFLEQTCNKQSEVKVPPSGRTASNVHEQVIIPSRIGEPIS